MTRRGRNLQCIDLRGGFSLQYDFQRSTLIIHPGYNQTLRQIQQIKWQNLQNSYLRRKRTEYYGILPLRDQILKMAKSSKFLSPPQADGVLRNFAPPGSDFVKARNPRSKLRGICVNQAVEKMVLKY
jgi:hypothetical protein